jgi:hypothetical protein
MINKKGVESLLGLIPATIGIVLIMVFFVVFASILLAASNVGGDREREQTSLSLIMNAVGFLNSETGGVKNWQLANSNSQDQSLLGRSLRGFSDKIYPIWTSGDAEGKFYSVIGILAEKNVNPYIAVQQSNQPILFPGLLLAKASPLHPSFSYCDKKSSDERVAEIYIPSLNSEPKKFVLCVK